MHPWYILKSDFSSMVSIFYVRSKRSSCLSQGWKGKIFSFQLLDLRSMILKWHSNLHTIICQVLWLFQYHLYRRLSIPPLNYMLPMKQPLKVLIQKQFGIHSLFHCNVYLFCVSSKESWPPQLPSQTRNLMRSSSYRLSSQHPRVFKVLYSHSCSLESSQGCYCMKAYRDLSSHGFGFINSNRQIWHLSQTAGFSDLSRRGFLCSIRSSLASRNILVFSVKQELTHFSL